MLDLVVCCTNRLKRALLEGLGVIETRRLLPQAPGFAANSVSDRPAATSFACPAGFTCTMAGAEEPHVTVPEISAVDPSEYVPVAVRDWVPFTPHK